ncbi:MAG: hypothetical protein SGCHY_000107 [Lobulomycetales sp.]
MQEIYLVTGCSRGIGLATCRQLLTRKARVVGMSRTAPEELTPNDFSHSSALPDPTVLAGRVRDRWNLQDPVRYAGIVLNAGVLEISSVRCADAASTARLFQINLISCFDLVSLYLPHCITDARVILVSSGASVKPMPCWAAYCASKAAGNMFIKCLALEEPSITALAIRPGVVDTPMIAKVLKQGESNGMPESFFKRFVDADLLSPDVPGTTLARAAMGVGHELSGEYVSWDDQRLQDSLLCP